MYKIYSFETYFDNKGNIKPTIESDDIKIISDALKKDKGYHSKLIDNDFKYKLYFDLDHIPDKDYIYDFIYGLSCKFGIADSDDIKYTESIKSKNEYSYHIVIPSIKATKEEIKNIVIDIKKGKDFINYTLEGETIINHYFDDSVYNNNNAFRLPNQTVDIKPFKHYIKRGDYEDFILNYFKTDAIELKTNIQQEKKKKPKVEKKPITFISDEQLKSLLDQLDPSYVDDYTKWSIITNIFKGIDKYKLWDEWSKGSDRYNRFKNLNIWKNTKKIKFSVNFLINIVGATDIYKEYKPLTNKKPDVIYNNKYVSNKSYIKSLIQKEIKRTGEELTPELEQFLTRSIIETDPEILTEFDKINMFDYSTVIIKSTTGTGKTTAIANSIGNNKILSIISRITLGSQIISSFGECNINIKDYQTEKYKSGDNYNVCINSLLKVDIDDDDLSETVIYIDEINSFVKHLMQLEGVDIKMIFIHLLYLIKNCKLLILSDAVISDSVFELIKARDNNIYFLENTYKKFKGVDAIRVLDEEFFKNKIEYRIKNNNYFLSAYDSKEIATKFYDDFISKYPHEKDSFLLITADHPFKITNASKQFLNKFVFYSPSITTAVDFSIDIPQDVFVYIKGNTIDPSESFQQATRTRNIKQLFYYIDRENGEEQYNDLENCSEQFLTFTKTANLLNNVSCYIDEFDEIKISNSTFTKLYIYIQYVKDIYNTNKLKHFQLILEQNEFELSEVGEKKKLETGFLLSEASKEKELAELEKYIIDPTNPEYERFDKRVKILNIPIEVEDIRKYANLIISQHQLENILDTIRFFKNDKYLTNKVQIIKNKNYCIKWMSSTYNKILLFRQFETKYNINFDYDSYNEELFDLPKNELDLYSKLFRFTFKPKTKGDLFKIYLSMIKHIAGSRVIKTERKQINKVKKYYYSFDTEYINKVLDMHKYTNPNLFGFDNKYCSLLNIVETPNYNNLDEFIDDI